LDDVSACCKVGSVFALRNVITTYLTRSWHEMHELTDETETKTLLICVHRTKPLSTAMKLKWGELSHMQHAYKYVFSSLLLCFVFHQMMHNVFLTQDYHVYCMYVNEVRGLEAKARATDGKAKTKTRSLEAKARASRPRAEVLRPEPQDQDQKSWGQGQGQSLKTKTRSLEPKAKARASTPRLTSKPRKSDAVFNLLTNYLQHKLGVFYRTSKQHFLPERDQEFSSQLAVHLMRLCSVPLTVNWEARPGLLKDYIK